MKVVAYKREEQGTGASRRLRKAGMVPGIIYGGSEPPVMIKLDQNALYYALKKETFHSSILEMEVDGQVQNVLLRDFQMHAFKPMVLHADFQRVDVAKKIHVKVPLHFVNAEVSPAVKLHSAVISHVATELEISCLAKDLPEFIEVDLSSMDAGQSLHLSNIALPPGVTPVLHGQEDLTIATAAVPAGTKSDEAEAGEGGEGEEKK